MIRSLTRTLFLLLCFTVLGSSVAPKPGFAAGCCFNKVWISQQLIYCYWDCPAGGEQCVAWKEYIWATYDFDSTCTPCGPGYDHRDCNQRWSFDTEVCTFSDQGGNDCEPEASLTLCYQGTPISCDPHDCDIEEKEVLCLDSECSHCENSRAGGSDRLCQEHTDSIRAN